MPLTEALFYILLAVRKPNHGYGIIQEVSDITNGRLVLGPGTLYGAINSMLLKQWIELYSEDKASRKKKEYLITENGKEVFIKGVVDGSIAVTYGKPILVNEKYFKSLEL